MQLPSSLPQIDELSLPREAAGGLMSQNQSSVQSWQYMFSQQPHQQSSLSGAAGQELQEFLTSTSDPNRTGLPDAVSAFPRSFGVPVPGGGSLRAHDNAKFFITGMTNEGGLTGFDPLHSQMSQSALSAENPQANMEKYRRDTWPASHSFPPSDADNMIVFGGNDSNKYSNIATQLNPARVNPALKIEDCDDELPRPSSMPSLRNDQLVTGAGVTGDGGQGHAPTRRKGRGGRTAAMDPRLDPSIDPKRAKRILANRQSAARSKNKQRGHLDTLQGTQNVLGHQKSVLLKEVAWLRAEVQGMEEEASKLEVQINVLREHSVLQEALQLKLLEECGQSFPSVSDAVVNNES